MKFGYILAALFTAVSGQVLTNEDAAPASVNLQVSYSFPEAPLDPATGAVILTNEEETAVTFYITNKESSPVVLAAFGGSIYDLKKPDTPYTNLTTSQVNPIQIEAGKEATVTQPIKLALPPKEFEIGFIFYVQFEDQIFATTLTRSSISVVDPVVSNWDPKLILVQAVIGLTATVIGFYASKKLVLPFIEKNLNKSKDGDAEKLKKKKYNGPAIGGKPSAKPAGDKSYDESWIPEHHLKKKKKE